MSFNPYYTWLGIPPEEQPPNHYRLLGVRLFEASCDVIAHAADRQMTYIRTLQTGERRRVSQQLLNEIAAARLVLLSPDRKAAYDAELRQQQQAGGRVTESPTIAAPPPLPGKGSGHVSAVPPTPQERKTHETPLAGPGTLAGTGIGTAGAVNATGPVSMPAPPDAALPGGSGPTADGATVPSTAGGTTPIASPRPLPGVTAPAVPMSGPAEYGLAPDVPSSTAARYTTPIDAALQAGDLLGENGRPAPRGVPGPPPRPDDPLHASGGYPAGNYANSATGLEKLRRSDPPPQPAKFVPRQADSGRLVLLVVAGGAAMLLFGLFVFVGALAFVLSRGSTRGEGEIASAADDQSPLNSQQSDVSLPAGDEDDDDTPGATTIRGGIPAEATGGSPSGLGPAPMPDITYPPFGESRPPEGFGPPPAGGGFGVGPRGAPSVIVDANETDGGPTASVRGDVGGPGGSFGPTGEAAGALPPTAPPFGAAPNPFGGPGMPGGALSPAEGYENALRELNRSADVGDLFSPSIPNSSRYSGVKQPRPETSDVESRQKPFREEFRDLLRDGDKRRQAGNTQSLIFNAKSEEDPITQFAMFEQAYEQAIMLDNSTYAREAMEELIARFEVDALGRKIQFAKDFAAKATTDKGRSTVASYAAGLFDEAMTDQRLAEARSIQLLVSSLGRKAKNTTLLEHSRDFLRRIHEYEAEQRKTAAAAESE